MISRSDAADFMKPWMIGVLLFSFLFGASVLRVSGKTPDISVFDLILVPIFTVWLSKSFFRRSVADFKINLLAALYISACLISLLFASIVNYHDIIRGLASLRPFVAGYAMFVLTTNTIRSAHDVKKLDTILIALGVFLSLMFLWSFYRALTDPGSVQVYGAWIDQEGSDGAREAKNSTFFLGNIGAYWIQVILPTIPLFCGRLAASRHKLRLLPLLLVFAFVLIASMSKGAMFGLVAAGLIALPRYWQHVFRWKVITGAVAVGLLLYLAIPKDFWEFNISIFAAFFRQGDAKRLDLWHAAWQLFTDHPILGAGPGSLAAYNHSHFLEEGYAHNFVLNVLAETGLCGIIPYVCMLAVIVRRAFCLPRTALGTALFVAVVATLLQGMVDTNFMGEEYCVVFWVIGGLITVISARSPIMNSARGRTAGPRLAPEVA